MAALSRPRVVLRPRQGLWRPRCHIFLLSPGLCDLLGGAPGPAAGWLCAWPAAGRVLPQGASNPAPPAPNPEPWAREAHQTREQRELLLHGAPRTQTPEARPPPVPPLPQWGGLGRRRGGRRAGLTQGPGRGFSTARRGWGSSEEEGGRRWALVSRAEPGRLRLQAGGWPLPSAPGPHPGAVAVGEGNAVRSPGKPRLLWPRGPALRPEAGPNGQGLQGLELSKPDTQSGSWTRATARHTPSALH